MKIIVAFDSFKGCMTAVEACDAAGSAIRQILPEAEVVEIALSDGGEGLVQSVLGARGDDEDLQMVECRAHGPLMEPMVARYALSADGMTAYMEMAETSGLPLVPVDKRNPMKTTTYGVGDMIVDAKSRGCKEIIMGIGGSATCDGGKGMLRCLRERLGGLDGLPHITVACDVSNPLYGPNGAAYVFAPQKGATEEQVLLLDEELRAFARETERLGIASEALCNYPGAGAAGGLGYGLMAYLHAELKSGIDIILDITRFDSHISGASLVITGEGKSDFQTLMGKVPHGVLKRCKLQGIPVCLMSGAIDDRDGMLAKSFERVVSINEGDDRPLDVLILNNVARENLGKCVQRESFSNFMRSCRGVIEEL